MDGGVSLIQHVDAYAGAARSRASSASASTRAPGAPCALHGRPRRELHPHLGDRRRRDQDLV